MRSPRPFSSSTTFAVPFTAGPSSSEVIRRAIDPLWEGCFATKCSAAGMGSFGETVPAERNAVDPDSLHQCLSALGLGHVELELAERSAGGERRGLCLGLSFLA